MSGDEYNGISRIWKSFQSPKMSNWIHGGRLCSFLLSKKHNPTPNMTNLRFWSMSDQRLLFKYLEWSKFMLCSVSGYAYSLQYICRIKMKKLTMMIWWNRKCFSLHCRISSFPFSSITQLNLRTTIASFLSTRIFFLSNYSDFS